MYVHITHSKIIIARSISFVYTLLSLCAKADRPRPYTWVLQVAHGLAAAQLAAHNLGIVHLDAKHDNVVIDDATLAATAAFYIPPM